MKKQLHLGAFMRPVGIHTGWWRVPGAYADANFNLKHLVGFIKKLEAARFDAFFMADHLAVLNMPVEALRRMRPGEPASIVPMENLLWCTVLGLTTGPSTSMAPWCTWQVTCARSAGASPCCCMTCSSASAAGWV